ncbi:phage tail termination protein [Streptomyces virginiae]|uniref:phage tail termination protein n=1 Tax=Streptomyces virginiae TaxID=1961 RepID=UPI003F690E4B
MAAVGSVDVELLVIQWLQGQLGSGVVVRDELDNNLLNELPTVQVERIPAGGDDGFRLDWALVDVNVYAAARSEAVTLSLQIRGLLLSQLPGSTTGGAVVGRVATVTAPGVRPYENTGLRRVGATYEIYSHPVS